MTSRGRTRKEQHNDKKKHYDDLEKHKPADKATEHFKHKPYQIHDVSSYIREKYGGK